MPAQNIRVCVRFRPLNAREKREQLPYTLNLEYLNENKTVKLSSNSAMLPDRNYNFDYCFGPDTVQDHFYDITGKPVVEDVLNGYNGTVFAYGQTGAGKSWSMMGDLGDDCNKGIIPRAAEAIFQKIESQTEDDIEYKISCAYLEIYNESIQDLLDTSKKNLKVHESPSKGIYVEDLTEIYVSTAEELYNYLDLGAQNRVVASTNMNAVSSRSHSVFIIRITQTNRSNGTVKNGSLNLVDLAGSEKVGKTGASGQTLEEAKKINQSLSALGQCINSLVENKRHIPFRDSKLTRILQQSLGGNSKTTMVCACSPSPFNAEETVSTLKFGQRAKTIKCRVKQNQVRSPKELERIIENLKSQIKKLKIANKNYRRMLSEYRKKEGLPEITSDDDEQAIADSEPSDKTSAQGDDSEEVNNPSLQKEDDDEDESMNIAELQLKYEELEAKYEDDSQQLLEDIDAVEEEKSKLQSEVKELEQMCEENEISLEELLEELDAITTEKENLEKKMTFQREESDIELEELLNTIDELEKEKKELGDKVARLTGDLTDDSPSQADTGKGVKDADSIEEGSHELSGDPVQRGKVLAELEQLRTLTQHQQGSIDRHGDTVSMIQGQLEEEKMQKSFVEDEFHKLQQKHKQGKEKNLNQIKTLKKEKFDINKKLSSLNNDLLEAEGDTKKVEKSLSMQNKKTTRYQKEMETLRDDVKKQNSQILELKVKAVGTLSDAEEEILEQYKNQMKQVQDASERQHKNQEHLIAQLQDEVADLTKRLHIAERKTASAASSIQDHSLEEYLQEQLTTVQTKLEKSENQLKLNKEKMEEALTQLTVEERKIKSKDEDCELIKKDFELRIAQLCAENESLVVEREQLKQQLDTAGSSDSSAGGQRGSFGKLVNELFELRGKYKKCDYERTKLLQESNHQRKVIAAERTRQKNTQKRVQLQSDRIRNLDEELQHSLTKESITKGLRDKFKQRENQYLDRIQALEKALEASQKSAALQKKHSHVYKPLGKR